MELTRRDALVALAGGAGVVGGGGGATKFAADWQSSDHTLDDRDVRQLTAVARVLYPSEVGVSREFVETYVLGRIAGREAHQEGVTAALDALRRESRRSHGTAVAALDEPTLEHLLREMGVDEVYPVPDGTDVERIKYYLVNDLLYALYTTPVGGRLVGYENPDGYPGGLDAYQRGPES